VVRSINKIKNKNILGLATGIFYTFTHKIVTVIANKINKNKDKKNSLLTKKNRATCTPELGRICLNEATNYLKGYLISQLITKTGRKYAPLKGAGIGTFYWMGTNRLTKRANLFIGGITGAITGLFVKHCGHDELFPYEVPKPNFYYKVLRIKRRSK